MDDNPYSAPQAKLQPSEHKQRRNRRPRGPDFLIATLLVFLGVAGWFFGLGFGLAGAGAWAELIFYAGPVIGLVGILWQLSLIGRR